ncbi:unnamed protein product, partial [Calicophoron daubneyi]
MSRPIHSNYQETPLSPPRYPMIHSKKSVPYSRDYSWPNYIPYISLKGKGIGPTKEYTSFIPVHQGFSQDSESNPAPFGQANFNSCQLPQPCSYPSPWKPQETNSSNCTTNHMNNIEAINPEGGASATNMNKYADNPYSLGNSRVQLNHSDSVSLCVSMRMRFDVCADFSDDKLPLLCSETMKMTVPSSRIPYENSPNLFGPVTKPPRDPVIANKSLPWKRTDSTWEDSRAGSYEIGCGDHEIWRRTSASSTQESWCKHRERVYPVDKQYLLDSDGIMEPQTTTTDPMVCMGQDSTEVPSYKGDSREFLSALNGTDNEQIGTDSLVYPAQ